MLSYDVVIPVFREGEYLSKAITALRTQNVKPRKIIVVDYVKDGQRTEVSDKGAEVWEIFTPGIGRARALGCEKSTADCILNIDADSEPDPDLARLLLREIEEGGAIASFGFGNFKDGEDWEKFGVGLFSLYKQLIPNGQCYAGLMVARYAYDFVGGFRDVPWEDSDLSFRLAFAYPLRVKYVPEALATTSPRRHRGLGKNVFALIDYTKAYRGDKEIDLAADKNSQIE